MCFVALHDFKHFIYNLVQSGLQNRGTKAGLCLMPCAERTSLLNLTNVRHEDPKPTNAGFVSLL